MKILYLTQWFDPEPGVIKGVDFVRALGAAGHEVTVVTGLPNYPTGRIYPGYRFRLFQTEEIDGVRVERLPLYPSHSTSSLGRALNFLSFFVSALLYGLLRGGRYDLAYVYHPPITVGLAAALFGPLRRLPFVLEIQDLWPDTVVTSGMTGTSRLASVLSGLCNFTYRRARAIVLQSEGMRTRLIERGTPAAKLHVIRNWADANALARPAAERTALGFGDGFALVYGGNLGRMQALDTAIDAMQRFAARGGTGDLYLIGDGIEREALQAHAARIGANNVHFVDRMPQNEVVRWYAAADALLLHIARDPLFEITIPSKTQFYLAAGKAIVAGIDGEAAAILRASGAAMLAPPQDADALCDAITAMAAASPAERDAMGERGAGYYRRMLGFEAGIAATLEVIAAAAR